MSVGEVFSILGNISTFLLFVNIVFVSVAHYYPQFRNWRKNLYHGKSWYGKYYGVLTGHQCCGALMLCIEQPVLVADLENITHFGHVSSRPVSQVAWTVLPELAHAGPDGIQHAAADEVRYDEQGAVMLKVRLEDLMQLLIRDGQILNHDNPWGERVWRQKTSYGCIHLFMRGRDMIGHIVIDPVPYNHPPVALMTGVAVKQLWENGYTGFKDELFNSWDMESHLLATDDARKIHDAQKISDARRSGAHPEPTKLVVTPCALSRMLFCLSQLVKKTDNNHRECDSQWDDIAAEVMRSSMEFAWMTKGFKHVHRLAELGSKMKVVAASVESCIHVSCVEKRTVCLFYHDILAGDIKIRITPAWTYKRTWFGPSSVYFGS